MHSIYMDYNATTPVERAVIDEMLPFLGEHFGNPSSMHWMGRAAGEAIESARQRVAHLLGADSDEIVFTSGGTESNNLALFGTMLSHDPPAHLVVSAIEHPAVTQPVERLRRMGYEVSVIPCDSQGVVSEKLVANAMRSTTALVSIMHANNEVGCVQPIGEIAEVCQSREVLFHTDAAQSVGKIRANVTELDVDLLSVAGHKLYAPKGIGALFVRRGTPLLPFMRGADHEFGLRPGTENTPYIVALGRAAMLAAKDLDDSADQLASQRDRLQESLLRDVPGLVVHGRQAPRLPNTLCVSFPNVSGQELLEQIPELCASTGSACHAGAAAGTLSAMGVHRDTARGAVRLSLGRHTTDEEVEQAASLLKDAWERLAS